MEYLMLGWLLNTLSLGYILIATKDYLWDNVRRTMHPIYQFWYPLTLFMVCPYAFFIIGLARFYYSHTRRRR